ncbi:hypothetical protein PIB30_000137 [Stylosanthes scabra]|uniref:FBD domain-containing protein n=1 Tax=Stylosanthes scabra TaxID=79078 RepID=A0ABU6R3K5_9FABA|nr:hypothetical protein [Stylosanthes scabra]
MDSGSSSYEHGSLKMQKQNNEGEDIISKLPEYIISSILSFLPTKYAVRTTVLSKAWMNLWTSITSLDINDTDVVYDVPEKYVPEEHFQTFINRSLLLTKIPRLESFSFSIQDYHYMSHLNNWIASALNRLLKKLCIKSEQKLRFSFVTSQCLEELLICMSNCSANIKVPLSHVHLGQLRFLTLHEVEFSCSKEDLELSLPLLRKLKTVNCIWLGSVNCVTFNAPLLETVDITQHKESSSQNGRRVIKFSALHLREFSYRHYGYLSRYITMIDPSSAQNASATLVFRRSDETKRVSSKARCGAFLLLKQFSQVGYLKFGGPYVLGEQVPLLPEFGMLSHLEITSITLEFLIGLLSKTPILNTLIVGRPKPKSDKALLESADVVPDCLRYTLQVVKFRDFLGNERELCLAKFLMENGYVLKKMSFSLSFFVESEDIEELKEKLFALKKCSISTVVEVLKEDYCNFW